MLDIYSCLNYYLDFWNHPELLVFYIFKCVGNGMNLVCFPQSVHGIRQYGINLKGCYHPSTHIFMPSLLMHPSLCSLGGERSHWVLCDPGEGSPTRRLLTGQDAWQPIQQQRARHRATYEGYKEQDLPGLWLGGSPGGWQWDGGNKHGIAATVKSVGWDKIQVPSFRSWLTFGS